MLFKYIQSQWISVSLCYKAKFLNVFIYSNTQKYIILLSYNIYYEGMKHSSNAERYTRRLTLRRYFA